MNNPAKAVYDEIESFGKAGFDFVDLTIEGPNASDFDTGRVLSQLQQYDLSIVGHTDPCLPYAYPIQSIRDACLTELTRCADIFSRLGAKIMNIHPCYFCPPAMRPALIQSNIEALRPIAKMAADHGLNLVFENFRSPFDRVSTFKLLLDKVPGLATHLDFGHTNMGHDDHAAFCSQLGKTIKHVHFSDNRATGDHHMPLGVGNVDWQDAVVSLKAIGYDETITLEVFCNDPGMQFQYLDLSRKFILDLWRK